MIWLASGAPARSRHPANRGTPGRNGSQPMRDDLLRFTRMVMLSLGDPEVDFLHSLDNKRMAWDVRRRSRFRTTIGYAIA